jgi:phosphoglycerate kinase
MELPKISDLEITGKKVLVRLDLDLPTQSGVGNDSTRIEASSKTLKALVEGKAKTIIIGHRGRPEGRVVKELSLAPLTETLAQVGGVGVKMVSDTVGEQAKAAVAELGGGEAILLENLRFNPGEENNDADFARALAALGEIYINEAFAVSHREHASIVSVPRLLPHAAGVRFIQEVENLDKVIKNPKKPAVIVISGIKKDKVEMAKALVEKFDKVLVGGRLPEFMGDNTVSIRSLDTSQKLIIANLIMDKEDITIHSIEKFKTEIVKAGTIVLAGVIGRYEDEGHRQGTKEIFEAVAASTAFKVAGGGDTEAALTMLGLTAKFDWISVGGGAMIEFLLNGTLPGIQALVE